MIRIGADVGGTFTDVLVLDGDGRVRFTKVLSTPPDYDRAVVDAVRELGGGEDVEASSTARPSPRTPCSSGAARAPRS